MNTRMAIGTEFFSELRSRYYFVDKSGFLSEFFREQPKVLLITRPRRFGKTLLLTMTQQFLDIHDAEEHRKLFEGLKVMDDPVAMAEQGTRPVVFISMKNVEWDTWDGMQKNMAWEFSDMYRPFRYLLQDDMLEEDRAAFESICARRANIETMSRAFQLLCRLLEAHHGRKAVLLIDEYDAPIQHAWSHGFYKDAIGFYRTLYSGALKTNPSLDFAILTGVLRIAKESIFSGLNNLKVSTVSRGGFADVCGYTKEEVTRLAHDVGHDDKLEELAEWYDGYNFQGVEIYNPWSVNNYFGEHCEAEAYWVNTSGNDIIRTLLVEADEARWKELQTLLTGGTVMANVHEGVIYDAIGKNSNDIYTMLLQTGYLKAVGSVRIGGGERMYELAIPNMEIRILFRRELMNRVDRSYGEVSFYKMGLAIEQGKAEAFQEIFQGILLRAVSSHDAADAESFYHGLMLGCVLYYENDYRVVSNRESGYGRFDLAMLPKTPKRPGVVMEFKAVAGEDKLEQAAEEALLQIEDKAYITELVSAGVKDIWRYGIAFCKKRVWVKRGTTGPSDG